MDFLGFDKETTKFEDLCEFYKDTPGVVHITYRRKKGGPIFFLGYITLVFATADACFNFLATEAKPYKAGIYICYFSVFVQSHWVKGVVLYYKGR